MGVKRMSVYLQNVEYLLSQTDVQNIDPKITQALDELTAIRKNSSLSDLINNPKFQNIINLLTPFVVNYKVNQVIKLLKDLESESKWWK
jgi:hypothetical protein